MLFWVALSKVTEVSAVATSLARGRQQPTRTEPVHWGSETIKYIRKGNTYSKTSKY